MTTNQNEARDQEIEQGTKETPKSDKPSLMTRLISLANVFTEFWQSPDRQPFASLKFKDTGIHHLPLLGTEFKYVLMEAASTAFGQIPNSRVVKEAIEGLAAEAVTNGEVLETHKRVARIDNVIYVDLCDKDWQVVKIDEDSWEVIENSPVKFIRTTGMRELPKPRRGGDLEDLRGLLPALNKADWVKLQGFLVGAFNPVGTQPVLIVTGGQGSGKSTLVQLVRELIDPNQVASRSMPKKIDELFVSSSNCRVLSFDNVSHLTGDQSDTLCQIASGGGQVRRKLYTDTDEVAITTLQPIILNGITDFVARPDLDERSLHIELEAMSSIDRLIDSEIEARFKQIQPELLGALFDAVSISLKEAVRVNIKELPRLAEFTKFVTAAESALAVEPGEFASVMREQAADRAETRALLDPVVIAIRELLAVPREFDGTVQALLRQIEDKLPQGHGSRSARWLSGQLTRLAPDFEVIGIHVVRPKRSRKGAMVRITQD